LDENDIIPGGYILLARKITDSDIWLKPPLYLKIWIYFLAKAQHSPYKKLKKGELFTSIPEIQEECFWYVGSRKVIPTKDQIFQVIDWFRRASGDPSESNAKATAKATMITTAKATRGMTVSISNYCIYQDSKYYESNGESNPESNAATSSKARRKQRQPDTNNKNGKNDNNDNEDINNSRESKVKFAEFVSLTNVEYSALVTQFGEHGAKRMIEILDDYKGASGKTYKSDYRAIRTWVINKYQEGIQQKGGLDNGIRRKSTGDKNRLPQRTGDKDQGNIPDGFWANG